ncbi:hypothetical protein [Elizabethkingia anophelis]|uniref:hypothetical protein n=1 Tax=Elizabethkingia anophelis TaxID=1117645 RepID=UPI0038923ADB
MKILKLVSFLSFLLIAIPYENAGGIMISLLFIMLINFFQSLFDSSLFNIENLKIGGLAILIIVSLLCLLLSKKKIIKIISYIILVVILLTWYFNANYKELNFNISNIFFSIVMPIIFIISCFLVVFKKQGVKE